MNRSEIIHRNAARIIKGWRLTKIWRESELQGRKWHTQDCTLNDGSISYGASFKDLHAPLEDGLNKAMIKASRENRPCVLFDVFSGPEFARGVVSKTEARLTYPQNISFKARALSLVDIRTTEAIEADRSIGLEVSAGIVILPEDFERHLAAMFGDTFIDVAVMRGKGALNTIANFFYGDFARMLASRLNPDGGVMYIDFEYADDIEEIRGFIENWRPKAEAAGFIIDYNNSSRLPAISITRTPESVNNNLPF